MKTLSVAPWGDYELLATGDGHRFERFGSVITERPDSNILWPLEQQGIVANAVFTGEKEEGYWHRPSLLPTPWRFTWDTLTIDLKLTPFRHVGVFPEQVANWVWLQDKVKELAAKGKTPRVLNLFGYTGAASIVAAQAGAEVCHVDASKNTVQWASENALTSGLDGKGIRWIVDDVVKFVQREVRRNASYDIIIMDPPVFGRGAQGEIWRLEDDLPLLLELCSTLLNQSNPSLLVNFYATALYPESILRLVQKHCPQVASSVDTYMLCLEEVSNKRPFQTGYSIRS